MAPAPAVDKWGADGFIAKLPPAGVLTGIKILPYKRGQRTRERNLAGPGDGVRLPAGLEGPRAFTQASVAVTLSLSHHVSHSTKLPRTHTGLAAAAAPAAGAPCVERICQMP